MNDSGGGFLSGIIMFVVGAFALFWIIAGIAWVFSFHGVDSGEIAIVREGGPFDGRNIIEVRQPGSGPKAIGAWNHQDNLPTTERDLTDEVENITVPSRDGVDMVVNGQSLFRLTTDPDKVKEFYRKYGRRKWDGHDLTEDAGWSAFLRLRLIPILQDTLRQTIGTYDCTQLKNTCVYVLEAEKIASGDKDVQDKAKNADNTQVIQQAQDAITKLLTSKIKTGLGGEYLEGIKFQNLRPDFTPEIATRVRAAQGKRAQVAETQLEAQRVKAEAKGQADKAVESAIGDRRSNEERAKGIRALARAYRTNPAQAKIDQTKAFCGPDGCDPQAIGSSTFQQLAGR